MIVTTTPSIQDKKIQKYHGIVTGEVILGANTMREIFARVRDSVGDRATAYEKEMADAREIALKELKEEAKQLGANAVVGIDLDFKTVGSGGMLMVSVSGTAVTVE